MSWARAMIKFWITTLLKKFVTLTRKVKKLFTPKLPELIKKIQIINHLQAAASNCLIHSFLSIMTNFIGMHSYRTLILTPCGFIIHKTLNWKKKTNKPFIIPYCSTLKITPPKKKIISQMVLIVTVSWPLK